jgi:hypothetical protein
MARVCNGAGKTTTLRMLLGLVRPTSGVIRVLGLPPGAPAALARIGSMGEVAFYPFLSGRDNLRAAARRCSIGNGPVEQVLIRVGLAERAGDKLAGYSLGMRQRLAVVAATLAGVARTELAGGRLGLDLRDHGAARAAAVNRGLVGAGLEVSEVRTVRRPLREVLLELTSGRTGGADSLRDRAGPRPAGRPGRARRRPPAAGQDR